MQEECCWCSGNLSTWSCDNCLIVLCKECRSAGECCGSCNCCPYCCKLKCIICDDHYPGMVLDGEKCNGCKFKEQCVRCETWIPIEKFINDDQLCYDCYNSCICGTLIRIHKIRCPGNGIRSCQNRYYLCDECISDRCSDCKTINRVYCRDP